MWSLLAEISWPQLREQWGRTMLVVGGISTGVALMVAINVINTSVLANFRRTIELMAGPAALQVVLGTGEVGFAESVLDTVRTDPDVVAAVPLLRGTIAPADAPSEAMTLFGADLLAEEDLRRYHITAATERRELLRIMEDPRSVLISRRYAELRALQVGDALVLSTPSGVHEFTVRGLLEMHGMAAVLGGELVVMDLPAAQLLLDRTGRIDQIDIVVGAEADIPAVRERLERTLPTELSVVRPARRGEQYERLLASFQAMLTGVSLMCLVAAVYLIYNTTSTGAAHRALSMAGLRIVGAEGSALFRLLLLEACVLGAAGVIGGVPIGIAFAKLFIGMVADSMAVIFKIRFPVEELAVDALTILAIGALGIACALFASFFAARRVGKMEPLAVLRRESIPIGAHLASRTLVLWWAGFVLLSGVMLAVAVRTKSIAWGNVGTTLWSASVIVIAVPLVSWSAMMLSRALTRLFPAEGEVAAHSLFRTPSRTGVTTAAIALVLTTAVAWTSISHSFRDSVKVYVEQLFAADLIVSAVSTEGGWAETSLPRALVDELAALRGVRRVEAAQMLAGQQYRGERVGVLALSDGLLDVERYTASLYREGDPALASDALKAGTGMNVSTALADFFGLGLGDTLTLETPTGPLSVPIVGVVADYISDRGSIIMGLGFFRDRWQDTTVQRINLYLEPGTDAEYVRALVKASVGDRYRLKVLSLEELLEYHEVYRRQAFAFTDAIQLLIIIVTIAGIFDLLLSAIIERKRELAYWRLIGADDSAVRRSVMLESGSIGTLGAVLGVAVSVVTAWIWVDISFPILLGYQLMLTFPLLTTSWYFVLVIVTTLLAGYLAATRAIRASILEGIRAD